MQMQSDVTCGMMCVDPMPEYRLVNYKLAEKGGVVGGFKVQIKEQREREREREKKGRRDQREERERNERKEIERKERKERDANSI